MNASYNTCVVPPPLPQERSYLPTACPAYPTFPDGSLLSYLRKVTNEEAPQESRPGSISEPYSFGKNLLTISNLAETKTAGNLQPQSFNAEFRHTSEDFAAEEAEEEQEEEEEPEKGLVDLVVTPSALATYTMTTLRQYIRMKGISPAGKRKQELIAAILEVCGDSSRLDRDAEGQRGAESLSEDSNSDGAGEGRPRRRRRRVATQPAASEKTSPIKKRRKQPNVAPKKKKGTPHTKREGPLPMILNEKGELVYDRHAHLRNRENGSCHRCKNKKKMNVVCPFAKSHLFCRACVERHCGFDFEDMKNNVEKHWSNGCPVCRGDCDCAYCKRTRKAGVPAYTPVVHVSTTSSTLVSPANVTASNIKRGLKRKSPEKKVKVEQDEEPEQVEDDVRMFLRSLKNENNGNVEEGDGGDQSPFTPKRQPYRRAAAGRKKRRSNEEYYVEEQQQPQDGIVRVTPAVIKKDGHYELLEKEASVEAFVGLTGAGSVLMSRHRTTIPLPPTDD